MAIDIYINKKKYKYTLEKVLKDRLNSQDRKVNKLGEIVFYPSVVGNILTNYENILKLKNNAYEMWLNNSLRSVYFELKTGEIVPLCLVQELELVPVDIFKSVLSKRRYLLSKPTPHIYITMVKSGKMYEVYIKYLDPKNCGHIIRQRVYVGTKDNLVKDLKDFTIDHVQPMKQTLSQNILYLPYLSAISRLIYDSGCKSDRTTVRKTISGYINYRDRIAYNGLVEELNLILRETKGLRMIASVMN